MDFGDSACTISNATCRFRILSAMRSPDELSLVVLDALVEEFIRTGRPVPVSVILERLEPAVSPAELGDCLSRLEAERLVESASGSVEYIPSHQGYDYYLDRS